MPSDISSFILVSKTNTKHQVSKWSCLVKKMRPLYTLIDSTYVIRIVEFISFMVLNNIDTNNWIQQIKFWHSKELAIPFIDENVPLYLEQIVNNIQRFALRIVEMLLSLQNGRA